MEIHRVKPIRNQLIAVAALMMIGDTNAANTQATLTTGTPSAGLLPLTLRPIEGRMYRWESSPDLRNWSPLPASLTTQLPLLGQTSTMSLSAPMTGNHGFYRVKETSYFDPDWADVKPLRTIPFNFDPTKTSTWNGADLRAAILSLIPGDHLVIGPGTYTIDSYTNISLLGTPQAPIWITAAPAASVSITRSNANQNLLNFGFNTPARYIAIRGIDLNGGANVIRLTDCSEIWIDRCFINNSADSAITSGNANARRLFITRNEIHHTDGLGEGIALGNTSGTFIVSESVIALNRVRFTNATTVTQGDGIEIKQGSWGNLISNNHITDTKGPCIIASGSTDKAPNIIENNLCIGSTDYGMMVTRNNIVRNNVVFGPQGAFYSGQIGGQIPSQITVVHNTFISTSEAARLNSWALGTGNVFANNACYSQSSAALAIPNGAGTSTFSGLVTYGSVPAGIPIAATGTGLGDFTNVSWTGSNNNATPSPTSPLRGKAISTHQTEFDFRYYPRTSPLTVGAQR